MNYELDNGKKISIPDKEIESLQKNLNISFNEAVYTWLVDEEYITDETVEELSAKAKKNRITATIHEAKAENSNKKERKPREKKENPTKKEIIQSLFKGLSENLATDDGIIITNDEKYLDFSINGIKFTVNLVQHREKKSKA